MPDFQETNLLLAVLEGDLKKAKEIADGFFPMEKRKLLEALEQMEDLLQED